MAKTASSDAKAQIRQPGEKPADHVIPEGLSKSPPVPTPDSVEKTANGEKDGPTRFGDWEKNGIAVDF